MKIAWYTYWMDRYPTSATTLIVTELAKQIACEDDIALFFAHHRSVDHPLYRYGQEILIPQIPLLGERALSRHNFDLIQFNGNVPWGFRIACPFLLSCKKVAWISGISDEVNLNAQTWAYRAYIQRALELVASRRLDVIVTISTSLKNRLVQYLRVPESKIRVIYPGIAPIFEPITDTKALEKFRARHGIQKRFILHISRFTPRKNPEVLFRVFRELVSAGKDDLNLVIAGGRWEDNSLRVQQLIKAMGIEERVQILGYLPIEDLACLYNLAELFFFPTLHENFGLPNIEAMACGTPVVTSNVYSVPEITGGAALMCPPDDEKCFVKTIQEILSNRTLYMDLRAKGLKNASRFTWQEASRQFVALYKELSGAAHELR